MLCPSCGGNPKKVLSEQKPADTQMVRYICKDCGLMFVTYERRDENEIGEHAVQRREKRKKTKPFSVSDMYILMRVRDRMAQDARTGTAEA